MYFGTLLIFFMINSWFIIANPNSGNRKFSKKWKEIEQLLQHKNIHYSFAFTKYSKHEIELVKNAIQKGYRNFISVGGDGTLHYVVNGIMTQRYVKTSDITIAVIPVGTGNDWIKTYNIPKNIEKSIEIIHKKKTILQDIGVLKTNYDKITYYNNVAGLGYDGFIVNKLKKLKPFGSLSYIIAGTYGLFFYKKSVFNIQFNGTEVETNCLMTILGICKYSGNGMQFTKDANTTDGFLDLTIAKNITFIDLLKNIRKLYNGNIVNHKKISTYKTKEISVIPKKAKTYIQADGELIGKGKVTVTIIEKAINFVIN